MHVATLSTGDPANGAAGLARSAPAAAAVRLEGLVKRFAGEAGKRVARSTGQTSSDGVVAAVDGVDLEIADGEFFSMLGPSGSGKTTTLRLIAGFELPTEGRVWLHGVDVTRKPPFERDVNTVFQDYALFPHMTVGDNVAYGLTVRKVPKADRERRVGEALAMVRLTGYDRRKPGRSNGRLTQLLVELHRRTGGCRPTRCSFSAGYASHELPQGRCERHQSEHAECVSNRARLHRGRGGS